MLFKNKLSLTIIKRLLIIYLINLTLFTGYIIFNYTFTSNSIKHLNNIKKNQLPISILDSENMKLLEDILIVFSDAAITGEIDMLKKAKLRKDKIIKNLKKLFLDYKIEDRKYQIELFNKYFEIGYRLSSNIINSKLDLNLDEISVMQKLSKKTVFFFKQKQNRSSKRLTVSLNNIANDTSIFFSNSLFLSIFALFIITVVDLYIYKIIKNRFHSIISSVKNLAQDNKS